jgi:hypothetical protein
VAKPTQSEADRLAAEELEKNPVAAKGHATPTRKEREAARKRPLVGANTVEGRRASRTQQQASRDRARVGLANGEEKYLPARDRGPQKRFVRDYVDARFSFGEILIPLVAVLFIATLVKNTQIQVLIEVAFYAYAILVLVDGFLLGLRLRKKLTAKYGEDRVERVRWYAFSRSIQLRVLRLPKPQVKRGQFPS